MKSVQLKLKLIFFPFLKLAIIDISIYTFTYWILFEKLKINSFKEDLVQIWIPIVFACITVFIWLRPRVHLLKLKTGNRRNPSTLYNLVAAAAIAVPIIISVQYIDEMSGQLIKLSKVTDIKSLSDEKYFSIDSLFIDTSSTHSKMRISYSGRYNEYLDMNLYLTSPIIRNESDTFESPPAFLGAKYHTEISSHISDEQKNEAYEKLYNESMTDFLNKDLKNF